jgi:ATP-dependent helicase/nuclease subunit A
LADRLLGALVPRAWPRSAGDALLAEVFAILDDPAFSAAFLPGGRAEVSIAGHLPGIAGPIVGQIDRLTVGESVVLIVDYKTDRCNSRERGRHRPGLCRPVGGLSGPCGKDVSCQSEIRAAILWTAAPRLMELPADMLAMHGSLASP